MKIAIIHNQYAKKGGMETYLFNLIEGFSAVGDEVEIVTYRVDSTAPRVDRCTIRKYWFLPFALSFGIWRKFLFIRYINKCFTKNSYDLSLSLTRTANQDLAICGGTHLGYLHHLQKKPSLKDKIEIYFERQSYLTSSHIVAHSDLLRDELINFYGIDHNKIHLIYPPLNTAVFNRNAKQRRALHIKNFAIDSTKTTLLFPSTGHQRKGLYELVAAMRELPSDKFELIVVGNKLLNFDKINLPHVRYLGYINGVDMAKLYVAVNFTILPSHYEPYGLVVAESLQCGTPVIISNRVGAKDLVNKDTGVVFHDVTPPAIAQAILTATAKNGFVIPENFAEMHGLTLEQHISKLRRYTP